MDLILHPRPLAGTVAAIPSKSWAHRLLFGRGSVRGTHPAFLWPPLPGYSGHHELPVRPGRGADLPKAIPCWFIPGGFLDAAACHAGRAAPHSACSCLWWQLWGFTPAFSWEGAASFPPLWPPWAGSWKAHGVRLSRPEPGLLQCRGKAGAWLLPSAGECIQPVHFRSPLCPPLLDRESTLTVTGPVESGPYLKMTLAALELFWHSTHSPWGSLLPLPPPPTGARGKPMWREIGPTPPSGSAPAPWAAASPLRGLNRKQSARRPGHLHPAVCHGGRNRLVRKQLHRSAGSPYSPSRWMPGPFRIWFPFWL